MSGGPVNYIERVVLLNDGYLFGIPSLVLQNTAHVKTLEIPNSASLPMAFIQNNSALTSVSVPLSVGALDLFVSDNPVVSTLDISSFRQVNRLWISESALLAISLPVLNYCADQLHIENNPLLTSVSLPSLTHVWVDHPTKSLLTRISGNAALTSVSMPLWKPIRCPVTTNDPVVDMSDNALDAASVNAILASCASDSTFTRGSLDLSGGTNAAPSGQGILDVATLQARGITVSTN